MRLMKRFEQKMEGWTPCYDEQVNLGERSIRSIENLWNEIPELCKGAKSSQYNSNVIPKTEERSNTAHSSTTIVISHFQFFLFLSLALYRSYGRKWILGITSLIWVKEHYTFTNFFLYLFYSFLGYQEALIHHPPLSDFKIRISD